jgi:sterol desaturase/sphingolipid hydroxylase (fatty acid hydroxylase superfamily)
MPWHQSVVITLGFVNAIVLLELLLSLALSRRVYSLAGTLTNVSAYTIYLIIAAIYGYLEYLVISYMQLWLGTARLPVTWWYWALLILADDFCFYWFHRLSHKLSLLWMSHVVHHSSHEFNFSVGLRQTWLPFLGILFWLPLALAGFRIEHILLVQAASLSYQFLMHTQLINLPRFWGFLFNTPSHHRVHHGMNPEYIDKNFAGVFILWDKLFGSFVPEKNPVTFGIHEPSPRGEIIFAQIWGPWAFIKNIFSRHKILQPGEDVYQQQKTSALLAALLLLLSLFLFFVVIKNPRWFL